MVLYIKTHDDSYATIDLIAKQMINIEMNKNIFDKIGNRIPTNLCTPFNIYNINQVEFNISVSTGVILMYLPNVYDTIIKSFINAIVNRIEILDNELSNNSLTTLDKLIDIEAYKSTTYTSITKKINIMDYPKTNCVGRIQPRRKILINGNEIKRNHDNGVLFVWSLKCINKDNYLSIPEVSVLIQEQTYLMKSISTIIVDKIDLFNIPSFTKQINYPSLEQYSIFDNKQILNKQIYISLMFGLDYEILKCYKHELKLPKKNIMEISLKLIPYTDLSISSFCFKNKHNNVKSLDNQHKKQIRRRNPKKEWYNQLRESFDYKKQEEQELNINESGKPIFPYDVCFITNAPLYGNAVVLKVSYKNKENTNSYILICKLLYYIPFIIDNKEVCISTYFKLKNIEILESYLTNMVRTESDAINMIPNTLIDPLKKEIMESISINGAYHKLIHNRRLLYAINIKKNKVYLGMTNIYDSDIIEYKNTNTILFNSITY
jgi:hypothetical protein